MTKHPESDNLIEIAAEILDPAEWLAMQMVKGGRGCKTQGEAMDMVRVACKHAIELSNKKYRDACEVLIAWGDHGGDAVEMLNDAVALAREAMKP